MKPGDRIRITETPPDYEYYSVGDVATVLEVENEGNRLLCDFNSNQTVRKKGQWWTGLESPQHTVGYEVIEIYRPGRGAPGVGIQQTEG